MSKNHPDFASFGLGQALAWLYGRNPFAMKLGLDNIRALLDYLGSPDKGLAILHVAGTNGKGSVCGNCAALLQAAGLRRVGLYTSPHLVSFRERIRVQGDPISREGVRDFIRAHGAFCENLGATYFEIATALALDYFRQQACDAVVLETGLGGRLDATNAVLPKVSVITPVDIDHVAQLGPTLNSIFAEKAAILKPGIPMVIAAQGPGLVDNLAATAKSVHSPLIRAEDHPWRVEGGTWIGSGRFGEIRLPADLRLEKHQRDNLALACLAVETFLNKPLQENPANPAKAILSTPAYPTASELGWAGAGEGGMALRLHKALPAGRTQVLRSPGHLPLVLDGAHNPHGLRALVLSLDQLFPRARRLFLFGMMADKAVEDALALIRGASGQNTIRLLPLWEHYARAWRPGSDADFGSPLPLAREALLAALDPEFSPHDVVIVCGSLYLLGEVIALLAFDFPELADFRDLISDRAGIT